MPRSSHNDRPLDSPRCSDEREVPGAAGDARRPPRRAAAVAEGHRHARGGGRAVRLPAHPDAELRGHRPLLPHLRAGLGHRAEGDVHVHRPGRPLAHAAAGGHRADRPRLRRARAVPGAAAGEAVHGRADVPVRGAPEGAVPRALQCSVEAIGSADPAVDAEVIHLYTEFARRVGITRYELQLNSIGDASCRPAYVERLAAWLDEHADVLDADARAKRATNPLRVFDVKNPAVREALRDAPKIGESLCAACRAHFARVCELLGELGVAYRLEPTLVRGLDYYTRTVFEFVGPEEKAQSAICSGGRYDGLIEEIGGPPTPAIGFGAGIERALLALAGEGVGAEPEPLDVFFAVEPGASAHTAVAAVRRAGFSADTDYAGRSLKGQLGYAQRRARLVVVVAPDGWTLRRHGARDRSIDLRGLLEELSA